MQTHGSECDQLHELTGANSVSDFTEFGYFAANANAIIQPIECATK